MGDSNVMRARTHATMHAMVIITVALLLLSGKGGAGVEGAPAPAPFLQQLADAFANIRLVPIHVPDLFSQVETTTTTTTTTTTKTPSSLVFKDGGWIQNGDSQVAYLVGESDVTWQEAKKFCQDHNGVLAEVRSRDLHYGMETLLANHTEPTFNYWIGLTGPFTRWDYSRRLVTWGNWPNAHGNQQKQCLAVDAGNKFTWQNKDCDSSHGFRALCQKHQEGDVNIIKNADEDSELCIVRGVSLDTSTWIERRTGILSSAGCHNICLRTDKCHFWTWDSIKKVCYLSENDSTVVDADYSHSGSTLPSMGCNRKIIAGKTEKIEACSCQENNTKVPYAEYLDPRSLPFNTEDNDSFSNGQQHLGRLIQLSTCPYGETLVCPQPDDNYKNKYQLRKPNITDCLVFDIRLTVSKAFYTLYDVSNAETCHAHCLATTGCVYWTWRGDLRNNACFLMEEEGKIHRRSGAASGTVLEKYGCRMNVILAPAQLKHDQLEDDQDECVCVLEEDDDIDWSSLLDPRSAPTQPEITGRIVNQPVNKNSCPKGHKRVCPDNYDDITSTTAKSRIPKLWNSPIQPLDQQTSLYGRGVELITSTNLSETLSTDLNPRHLESTPSNVEESFVNFPE